MLYNIYQICAYCTCWVDSSLCEEGNVCLHSKQRDFSQSMLAFLLHVFMILSLLCRFSWGWVIHEQFSCCLYMYMLGYCQQTHITSLKTATDHHFHWCLKLHVFHGRTSALCSLFPWTELNSLPSLSPLFCFADCATWLLFPLGVAECVPAPLSGFFSVLLVSKCVSVHTIVCSELYFAQECSGV